MHTYFVRLCVYVRKFQLNVSYRKYISGTAFAVALGLSGYSHAVVVNPGGDGPGTSLQDVFNALTIAPTAGLSSINVNSDQLSDFMDSYWSISASGGSVATIVVELAGFKNTSLFGIYDVANPAKKVTMFGGSASVGSQRVISIMSDGSVFSNFVDTGINFSGNNFGYFLNSIPGGPAGGEFFSDTTLNTDGIDHMVAFQGKGIDTVQIASLAPGLWTTNEYALAWEDLSGGGDGDYQDFVVMVESVVPTAVPIPAAAPLFGSGLLGLIGLARRRSTA
jgi:hypothetical protein